MNLNYFKLLDYPYIKINGFSELKDYMYVTNSRVSNNLYFHVDKLPERDYRFRIDLPDTGDRVIPHPHLYHLLNHFGLDNKVFIFDAYSGTYMPTSIPVEGKE